VLSNPRVCFCSALRLDGSWRKAPQRNVTVAVVLQLHGASWLARIADTRTVRSRETETLNCLLARCARLFGDDLICARIAGSVTESAYECVHGGMIKRKTHGITTLPLRWASPVRANQGD